jgi:glycerol uptake facilitator-like aquaporin
MPYICAQCLGAILASATLFTVLGNVGNLGATLPLNDNWQQAFIPGESVNDMAWGFPPI